MLSLRVLIGERKKRICCFVCVLFFIFVFCLFVFFFFFFLKKKPLCFVLLRQNAVL